MNERIEKLADRANGPNPFFGPLKNHMVLLGDEAVEKFAELIVAEMLQTCEDHPAWTGRMIGEEIKQHFGVEE